MSEAFGYARVVGRGDPELRPVSDQLHGAAVGCLMAAEVAGLLSNPTLDQEEQQANLEYSLLVAETPLEAAIVETTYDLMLATWPQVPTLARTEVVEPGVTFQRHGVSSFGSAYKGEHPGWQT